MRRGGLHLLSLHVHEGDVGKGGGQVRHEVCGHLYTTTTTFPTLYLRKYRTQTKDMIVPEDGAATRSLKYSHKGQHLLAFSL
jgi:hypothetical protein